MRFMLQWKNAQDETQTEFTDGYDGEDMVELAARFKRAQLGWIYKRQDFQPEYSYHAAELNDPEAAYKVFREAEDGSYLLIGAVRCELIPHPVGDFQMTWELCGEIIHMLRAFRLTTDMSSCRICEALELAAKEIKMATAEGRDWRAPRQC